MWQEFKTFAMRGSVIDLAVGVVIGAAFGTIVTSLVNDIIMPIVGRIVGQVDFSNLFIDLSGKGYTTLAAAQADGAATINYGVFINNVINFLIVAFAIFMVVRWMNRLTAMTKPEEAPAAPTTKTCPFCMSEIHIEATRCPHCTSEQPKAKAAKA